jgi:hypothetical protein
MPRPMKMWIGNLDGQREGLVIAATKKRAIEVIGTRAGDFNDYWVIAREVDTTLKHETLYTRPYRIPRAAWQEGKCPL